MPVVAGGLYDRYRSNTPLSVVASEAPTLDLSWFQTLKREKMEIGFESWSPNFYYENTLVTAVFTADLDVNLDHAGRLSSGYAVSRKMQHASSFSAADCTLPLGDGSLSTFIKSLKLGRMIQHQYVPSFQSALYAPKPLAGQQ